MLRVFQRVYDAVGLGDRSSRASNADTPGVTLKSIQALAKSSQSSQRLLFATHVIDFCHEIGYTITLQHIITLLRTAAKDSDKSVKTTAISQFGGMAGFLIQNDPENGYNQTCSLLLPCLFDILQHDTENVIRHHAAEALFMVASHLRFEERHHYILNRVLDMSMSTNDSLRELGVFILNGLAEALGPETCRSVVAPRLVSLSEDSSVRVRRAAALNCGEVARVMGSEACRVQLLPAVFRLGVADDHHLVRKATLESVFSLALSLPIEARRQELANFLRRALRDPAPAVSSAATQLLGPFLATLSSSLSPEGLIVAAATRARAGKQNNQQTQLQSSNFKNKDDNNNNNQNYNPSISFPDLVSHDDQSKNTSNNNNNIHDSHSLTSITDASNLDSVPLSSASEVEFIFGPSGLCSDLFDRFINYDSEESSSTATTTALSTATTTQISTSGGAAAAACAFSLGGVLQAHGFPLWPKCRAKFYKVAKHPDSVIRRSISASLHAVAEVLLRGGTVAPPIATLVHAPVTELSTCALPTFATSIPSTKIQPAGKPRGGNNGSAAANQNELMTKSPSGGVSNIARQTGWLSEKSARVFTSTSVFDANRDFVHSELYEVFMQLLNDSNVDVVRALLLHVGDFAACLPLSDLIDHSVLSKIIEVFNVQGSKCWRTRILCAQQLTALTVILLRAAEFAIDHNSIYPVSSDQYNTETTTATTTHEGPNFQRTLFSNIQSIAYKILLPSAIGYAKDSNASVRRVGSLCVSETFRIIALKSSRWFSAPSRDTEEYLAFISSRLWALQLSAVTAHQSLKDEISRYLGGSFTDSSTSSVNLNFPTAKESMIRRKSALIATASMGAFGISLSETVPLTTARLRFAPCHVNDSNTTHDNNNNNNTDCAFSENEKSNINPAVPTACKDNAHNSDKEHKIEDDNLLVWGNLESGAAWTIVSILALGRSYSHRQSFLKTFDNLLRVLPRALAILYFYRPFCELAFDRVANVRLLWAQTALNHLRACGRLLHLGHVHCLVVALAQVDPDKEVRTTLIKCLRTIVKSPSLPPSADLSSVNIDQLLTVPASVQSSVSPTDSSLTSVEQMDHAHPAWAANLLLADGLSVGELRASVHKSARERERSRQLHVSVSLNGPNPHAALGDSASVSSAATNHETPPLGGRKKLLEEIFGPGGSFEAALLDACDVAGVPPAHHLVVTPKKEASTLGDRRTESVSDVLLVSKSPEKRHGSELAHSLHDEVLVTDGAVYVGDNISEPDDIFLENGEEVENDETTSPVPSPPSSPSILSDFATDEYEGGTVVHLETEFGEFFPTVGTPRAGPREDFDALSFGNTPQIVRPSRVRHAVGGDATGEETEGGEGDSELRGLGLPGGIAADPSLATFEEIDENGDGSIAEIDALNSNDETLKMSERPSVLALMEEVHVSIGKLQLQQASKTKNEQSQEDMENDFR